MRLEVPPAGTPPRDGVLRLGTFRSVWTGKEVDASPALRFLHPSQVVEMGPADADRLGVREGDRVEVRSNGTRVYGPVKLRASVPGGSVFLAEGIHEGSANLLTEPLVEVRRVGRARGHEPSAVPAVMTPAGEGLAEAKPSAPLDIPPVGSPQSEDGSAA